MVIQIMMLNISATVGDIGTWCQWMTNRKRPSAVPMVTWLMTSSDPRGQIVTQLTNLGVKCKTIVAMGQIPRSIERISSWLYECKRARIINYHRVVTYLFHDQWRGWRPLWFSEHRRERFVTLGWSEIIGRYNTPDRMTDIGPKK